MRKNITIYILGIVAAAILCVTGIVMAYTYDSEIDPAVFNKWEVVVPIQTSDYGGLIIVKNPDPNAKIKEVVIKLLNGNVVSYAYSIDGKVYAYQFNDRTENYDYKGGGR